jgi:excisionase family DNA binding protein
MTKDIFLTPTDVAEALGCDLTTVLNLIESNALAASRQRGWRIAHSELARFIIHAQRSAWELGQSVTSTPSFVASRPLDD